MGVNRLPRISLAANVILTALVLWLVRRAPVAAGHSLVANAVPVADASPEVQAVQSAAPAVAEAVPKQEPFRWSQLESTDYRVYLANLRSIGCPEQTIRDILTADVDSVYAPRREPLERSLTGSLAARPQVEAQLQELRHEEAWFLASLLGDAQPVSPPPGNTSWVSARRIARLGTPLVLADLDPAALHLDPSQVSVVNEVRQRFQNEIGTQDTNDPAYRQRWNMAQRNADARLRGLLGSTVYIQCQLQAANEVSRPVKSE